MGGRELSNATNTLSKAFQNQSSLGREIQFDSLIFLTKRKGFFKKPLGWEKGKKLLMASEKMSKIYFCTPEAQFGSWSN